MDRRRTIANNAKLIRAEWPDRTERKARCEHIRQCGGLIGAAMTDIVVASGVIGRAHVATVNARP